MEKAGRQQADAHVACGRCAHRKTDREQSQANRAPGDAASLIPPEISSELKRDGTAAFRRKRVGNFDVQQQEEQRSPEAVEGAAQMLPQNGGIQREPRKRRAKQRGAHRPEAGVRHAQEEPAEGGAFQRPRHAAFFEFSAVN